MRRKDGGKRIVECIRELVHNYDGRAAYFLANKRFAILAKLIDNWVEPTMHRHGYNLYDQGGALAYVTMLSFCMPAFVGGDEFDELLQRFQLFSRDGSEEAFDEFFDFVAQLLDNTKT
jgi:hypothetical protein